MKSLEFASILLLSLTIPQMATAQSARGTYRFLLEDDLIKSVEFEADEKSGRMIFTDEAKILDGDDVENPERGDAREIYVRADFNGLKVEKNRAVMSGIVSDSSHVSYIGTVVHLVVEDNAENPKVPDRLTWAFCKRREGRWVPTDAERKDDDGAYLKWWATDAERDDDVGIPSLNLLPDGYENDCQVLPLWSYDFAAVLKWEGDIIVQP
ncbi:MAG TPA: hypothetical protein VNW71_02715 [Thermoanaerobaculia bacterium]|nr:hypothetical protein [Thermoanaerobaculia bacterium]